MDNILFDNALSLLIDATYDHTLPEEDLLLKLAGAAVGFGLEVACDYPEYVDRFLFSENHHQLQQLIDMFVKRSIQDSIARAAEETGAPALAVVVMLIIQSYREVEGEPDSGLIRDYGRALSRFCLRFVLMLWSKNPQMARHYREFIPV